MTRATTRPMRRRGRAGRGLGRQLARARCSGSTGEWWRSTRTRLSPGLRPEMGRRPPITAVLQPVRQPRDEALREAAGRHHRRLDRRRRRRPCAARSPIPASVSSSSQRRGRDAVARLADAARVEQDPPARRRRAASRRPGSSSPAGRRPRGRRSGRWVWPWRPTGVVHRGHARPGDRRRGHVLPDRVARAAVDEREALALEALGQGGQPGPRLVGDRRARPLHRPARVHVERLDLEPAERGRVVVAADARPRRSRAAARRPRPAPARSPRRRPGARPRPRTGRRRARRRGPRGSRGCRRGRRRASRAG